MCTVQPPARPGDRQSGEKGRVGAGVGVWAPAGAGAGMQSLAPEPGFMLYGNEDIASIPSIKPSYLVGMIPAMAPPPSPGSWLPWSSVPVCRAGRGGAGRPQWRCSRGLVPPRHSAADSQYSGLQHPANTAFIPHTAPGRQSLSAGSAISTVVSTVSKLSRVSTVSTLHYLHVRMCVQHVGLQAQLPAPHRDPGRGLQGAEGRDHGGQPRRQARHGHGECVCV